MNAGELLSNSITIPSRLFLSIAGSMIPGLGILTALDDTLRTSENDFVGYGAFKRRAEAGNKKLAYFGAVYDTLRFGLLTLTSLIYTPLTGVVRAGLSTLETTASVAVDSSLSAKQKIGYSLAGVALGAGFAAVNYIALDTITNIATLSNPPDSLPTPATSFLSNFSNTIDSGVNTYGERFANVIRTNAVETSKFTSEFSKRAFQAGLMMSLNAGGFKLLEIFGGGPSSFLNVVRKTSSIGTFAWLAMPGYTLDTPAPTQTIVLPELLELAEWPDISEAGSESGAEGDGNGYTEETGQQTAVVTGANPLIDPSANPVAVNGSNPIDGAQDPIQPPAEQFIPDDSDQGMIKTVDTGRGFVISDQHGNTGGETGIDSLYINDQQWQLLNNFGWKMSALGIELTQEQRALLAYRLADGTNSWGVDYNDVENGFKGMRALEVVDKLVSNPAELTTREQNYLLFHYANGTGTVMDALAANNIDEQNILEILNNTAVASQEAQRVVVEVQTVVQEINRANEQQTNLATLVEESAKESKYESYPNLPIDPREQHNTDSNQSLFQQRSVWQPVTPLEQADTEIDQNREGCIDRDMVIVANEGGIDNITQKEQSLINNALAKAEELALENPDADKIEICLPDDTLDKVQQIYDQLQQRGNNEDDDPIVTESIRTIIKDVSTLQTGLIDNKIALSSFLLSILSIPPIYLYGKKRKARETKLRALRESSNSNTIQEQLQGVVINTGTILATQFIGRRFGRLAGAMAGFATGGVLGRGIPWITSKGKNLYIGIKDNLKKYLPSRNPEEDEEE
jgi:hypothetical protein